MRVFSIVAALALLAPVTAIQKTKALKALADIGELKSMDMEDIMCDECLEEIDCIWPCELACVLDYPEDYAGRICMVCLEYFGCEGCKFMCPTPSTTAPTSFPTSSPTMGPTEPPSKAPTTGPTAEPTEAPTPAPSAEPTTGPSGEPTFMPSPAPSAEPTGAPYPAPTPKPSAEPTAAPTYEPTSAPSGMPSFEPSAMPSYPPTPAPSPSPTIMPTSSPTIPPTGAPTPTPDFYVYYSCTDSELYSYNPISHKTEYLYNGDFSGDMKVDSVNKFLFWSSPSKGHMVKYDLTDATDTYVVEDYDGLMGIAVDPSRGELYFVDQGTLAVMIIDYAGTNYSVVHDLSDYAIVPYGIDVSPAATIADFNEDDPGVMMITGCDDKKGYMAQANLFGGLFEIFYTTTSKAIYGLVMDTVESTIYWMENRGVANGLYSMDLSGKEQQYITYLEQTYWVAAVWSLEMLYVADYSEGAVYELDLNIEDGSVQATNALAYCDNPRVIAFYYGSDDTTLSQIKGAQEAPRGASVGPAVTASPNTKVSSSSSSAKEHGPTDSTQKPTDATDFPADSEEDTDGEAPVDGEAPAEGEQVEGEGDASSEGDVPPAGQIEMLVSSKTVTGGLGSIGLMFAVVGVAGLTVYTRRRWLGYKSVSDEDNSI